VCMRVFAKAARVRRRSLISLSFLSALVYGFVFLNLNGPRVVSRT